MTCVTQESFNFLKVGSTRTAAGTRVRREGDSEKEEVVPPSTAWREAPTPGPGTGPGGGNGTRRGRSSGPLA